ncbi:MAG TPA: gluconokinase [Beutenbergiaceae bacterium]|nr:gluconokinase [Beutenbergiaceae bacterium]
MGTGVDEGAVAGRAPWVLAFDVGSSGTRGGVFDATGTEVPGLRGKARHQFVTDASGTAVIDADEVVNEIAAIIDDLTAQLPAGAQISGVGIDTFSSSLVGVNDDDEAVTPCFTYADTRCSAQVTQLREELDEDQVHQRTGARLHTSYTPARLRWLSQDHPEMFAAATRWLTLGEYVYLRLLGTTAVGSAAAAWSGMLDRVSGAWDEHMVRASGISLDQLSPVHDPDQPITPVGSAATALAGRWPALADARWYPAIGDGLAANFGADAATPGVVGVSAATSGAMRTVVPTGAGEIPSGLWAYRFSAERTLLGGAVSDVGRVASWAEQVLRVGGSNLGLEGMPESTSLDALLRGAPGPGTPMVLPFFSGERSTGWATEARAHILDLTAATTADQIYRGALEATALSLGRIADQLRTVTGPPQRIAVGGGMAKGLPGWLQILADVLRTEVVHVRHTRSTLRGTALLALEDLAPGVPRSRAQTGLTYQPNPDAADYYAERRERFDAAYRALISADA